MTTSRQPEIANEHEFLWGNLQTSRAIAEAGLRPWVEIASPSVVELPHIELPPNPIDILISMTSEHDLGHSYEPPLASDLRWSFNFLFEDNDVNAVPPDNRQELLLRSIRSLLHDILGGELTRLVLEKSLSPLLPLSERKRPIQTLELPSQAHELVHRIITDFCTYYGPGFPGQT